MRTFGHVEAFAAIAALSFGAARFLPLLDLPYACPFRALTGLPCATCGMTHAFVHLAHGEAALAFQASPAGALLAALAWAFAAAAALRLAAGLSWPSPSPRAARALALAGAAALLANWAFLVVASRS
ncbi:MAG: DUF2752 domain-containing protein [Anaeromyxobacteraceae bacterium]